jgi:general nucleoside transport system permease protein
MILQGQLRFVKRTQISTWMEILSVVAAVALSILASALLIATSGANPNEALLALFNGAFGSREAILETIVQATPLIFTGLAVLVAFRGKVWNIGAEGQFWAGAIAATWVSLTFAGLPRLLLLGLILLVSATAGALWGLIPGVLKMRFGANVVIVTIMMNYLIQYLLSYLLSGVWRDPDQFYIQTQKFSAATNFPTFFESRIHLGLLVALAIAVVVYLLLWKTPLGYEIRAIGDNPVSSRYKGINVEMTIVVVMLISGAIAGLAGGSELSGLHHRLKLDISSGYGFTGILIALLGRLNPFGVILASIFFGGLVNGSTSMQIFTGVPVALVYVVQGIVLIFLLIAEVAIRYRLERVRPC